jgi:hypothetical protein
LSCSSDNVNAVSPGYTPIVACKLVHSAANEGGDDNVLYFFNPGTFVKLDTGVPAEV